MMLKIYPCDSGLDKCPVCYGKKKCPYARIILNDIKIIRNDEKK
jgi:hypothetical protein